MSPDLKERLSIRQGELTLYCAGLSPVSATGGYVSNFTRDSILSAVIGRDAEMLRDQLKFGVLLQAREKDPKTGAEVGKYHHEFPGVEIRGLSTLYNGSDTTAWALIGHGVYEDLTGDRRLADECRSNIAKGADYILTHLNSDGLFVEDPKFSGADNFALKVTYWKDSELPDRVEGEPLYPIVYTLAHIQNMAGLRSAARLLGSPELLNTAETMRMNLPRLWNTDLGTFNIAMDQKGVISAISSDPLNALFFLEPTDLLLEQAQAIISSASVLETSAGYRVLDPETSHRVADKYHAVTVWPSEQAVIHIGARKHRRWAERVGHTPLADSLIEVEAISARVVPYLKDNNVEMFIIENGQIRQAGCDPQLWTVEAKVYFDSAEQPVLTAA